MIALADGTTAEVGDVVYNYYDMTPVTIIESCCVSPDCTGCGFHGWYRTSGATLNGERMCSLDTARRRGYPDA